MTPNAASDGGASAPRTGEDVSTRSASTASQQPCSPAQSAEASSPAKEFRHGSIEVPEGLPELLDASLPPQRQPCEISHSACSSDAGDAQILPQPDPFPPSRPDSLSHPTSGSSIEALPLNEDILEGSVKAPEGLTELLDASRAQPGEMSQPEPSSDVGNTQLLTQTGPAAPSRQTSAAHSISDPSVVAAAALGDAAQYPPRFAAYSAQSPQHKPSAASSTASLSPGQVPSAIADDYLASTFAPNAISPMDAACMHRLHHSPTTPSPGPAVDHTPFEGAPPTAPPHVHAQKPPPHDAYSRGYMHGVRGMLAAAAAQRPTVIQVLAAMQYACRTAIWAAVGVVTLWLWGAIFGWLVFAAAWLLSKWAAAAATRYAAARLRRGCAALIRAAVRTAIWIPLFCYQLAVTIVFQTVASSWGGARYAAHTSAEAAQSWWTRIRCAAAAAAARMSAMAERVGGACTDLVTTAVLCASRAAAWVGTACAQAAELAQAAACITFGVTVWLTCMWVSALCWVVLAVREGGKTASSVAGACVAPLGHTAWMWIRPTAQKV